MKDETAALQKEREEYERLLEEQRKKEEAERKLFEQSAVKIQSIFRGYIVRKKLENGESLKDKKDKKKGKGKGKKKK